MNEEKREKREKRGEVLKWCGWKPIRVHPSSAMTWEKDGRQVYEATEKDEFMVATISIRFAGLGRFVCLAYKIRTYSPCEIIEFIGLGNHEYSIATDELGHGSTPCEAWIDAALNHLIRIGGEG